MHKPAEHFINEEQRWKCTRIWLWNGPSHAKISSTVMQDLSMALLTPHILVQPYSSLGKPPCLWNASSVKWHGTFSQWDVNIWQVSRNMSHMCALLRWLRNYTSDYLPEGNPCRKSKVRNESHPKIPRLDQRGPGNGHLYGTVIDKLWYVLSKLLELHFFRPGLLRCAHNPKVEFALAII